MVCELHFELKTAILVIAIIILPYSVHVLCETTCQIVAWYEHGQHCSATTQRLRLCTVILAQKAKLNSTQL